MTAPARILIIEDDDALRRTLADVLVEEGYAVACAENGLEALAQLDGGALPNVILLDLSMPVMDGWSFRAAQRLEPRLARIPTVAVSASLWPDADAVEDLGVEAYLPKPFDLDRLMRTIRRLCSRHPGAARPAGRAGAGAAAPSRR